MWNLRPGGGEKFDASDPEQHGWKHKAYGGLSLVPGVPPYVGYPTTDGIQQGEDCCHYRAGQDTLVMLDGTSLPSRWGKCHGAGGAPEGFRHFFEGSPSCRVEADAPGTEHDTQCRPPHPAALCTWGKCYGRAPKPVWKAAPPACGGCTSFERSCDEDAGDDPEPLTTCTCDLTCTYLGTSCRKMRIDGKLIDLCTCVVPPTPVGGVAFWTGQDAQSGLGFPEARLGGMPRRPPPEGLRQSCEERVLP